MKKGFYVSLAVGVAAIAAVGMISAQNTKSQEQPEHRVQIEKQAETPQPEMTEEPQKVASQTKPPESQKPVETKEPSAVSEKAEPLKTEKPEEEPVKKPAEEKKPEEKAPEVSQVMSGADSVKNLSFQEENGLIWPVMGDVLLKYSMDRAVYFKTLAQYKINPAVIIAAKENTEVLSAAKCVVTDISENEETGVTLTATLGNGYEVVYGQLKGVEAKVGDTIEKGSVLGKIAKPTKYYVAEGENLYFEVLQDGEPIDPLLLLE